MAETTVRENSNQTNDATKIATPSQPEPAFPVDLGVPGATQQERKTLSDQSALLQNSGQIGSVFIEGLSGSAPTPAAGGDTNNGTTYKLNDGMKGDKPHPEIKDIQQELNLLNYNVVQADGGDSDRFRCYVVPETISTRIIDGTSDYYDAWHNEGSATITPGKDGQANIKQSFHLAAPHVHGGGAGGGSGGGGLHPGETVQIQNGDGSVSTGVVISP